MEQVLNLIQDDLKQLEVSIEQLVTTRVGFIKKMVQYIVKSGGKRIRPILLMLSSKLCGYSGEKHITYSAIIEFIHTTTLLHDDVIDNAKTRRGASTANTIWGNEASVLVGDFLYTKSFELMAEGDNFEIIKTMAHTTKQLSEGEILELLKTSDIQTSEENYFEIIGNKTAVLFSVACEIGAILGNADEEKRHCLKEYGTNLGMAFQLTDDMLDYNSYDEVLGKKVGTDLKEGKITLPLISAMNSATDKERAVVKKVLEKSNITLKDFERVRAIIEKHNGIQYTSDMSMKYINAAKDCLKIFEPSPYKDALLKIPDYIHKRKT
jgi:octaprenyl-diphosphate synthase